MSWNNDIFSDFLTLIFLAWFFSEMLAVPLLYKAKGVVSGIPKAVLKFFGIRSPSRLMMEYGGYIT
ncbi:hypothetical protein P4Y87_27250, partial [Bacillus thuringiensis]|nr:hypothetical protein [Bacillus thuringiensis]